MKRIISFVFFLILCAAPSMVLAQTTVRNGSGSRIHTVDRDGTIRDANGTSIGKFDNGTFRNASGSRVGSAESDGTVRNGSGSRVATVEKDGTVRNSSGSRIGSIENDGTVRNSSGSRIGEARDLDKRIAVALFFTEMYKKK